MRLLRTTARVATAAVLLAPPPLRAQAPATGLLVLLLPASPRATALGNAWVAGRDDYSLFYNPAQIAPTNGIGGSFARYAPGAAMGALTGATTVGSITFGWGAQLAELRAASDAIYPLTPASLVTSGPRSAASFVAAAGANRVFKGFRTGVALKYAEDRLDLSGRTTAAPVRRLLGDAGVSHPLYSGTVALAVQNIGDDGRPNLPMQAALGWARQFQPGQLDVGVATQLLERRGWLSPAAGLELGYGWIEGWSASLRAGARRPETSGQRPLTFGGGLNADRLALDYALEFFAGRRYGHHLGVRWR